MKRHLFLFVILFSISDAIGQYRVVDEETKQPIAYAHIKLAGQAKGALTNVGGMFSLNSTFSDSDTVYISCIGYIDRSILIKDIRIDPIIGLETNYQQLAEVVISSEKAQYQTKKLGLRKRPRKGRLAEYAGTAKNGEERATWIPNEYSIAGNLKSMNIYVSDLGYPDAHFRVHVYESSPFQTTPGKELTKSNIIASATKGNEWVTIDMRLEQISIQENGCFIGIEWFDSPLSNSYHDTIFTKGYTYTDKDQKDTIYSRIRKGNGAVLGAVYQKYSHSKNKLWHKEDEKWLKQGLIDETIFYTYDTLPNGTVFYRTPDNYRQGVLCINIDVAFPKNSIKSVYDPPKKRKLNKIKKVRRDLIKYPQSNISELFSSLTKAFEDDNIIYILKYLCVYQDDELEAILNDLNVNEQNGNIIPEAQRTKATQHLQEIQTKLDSAVLEKIDGRNYKLSIGSDIYNITVEEGLWRINPYSSRIQKLLIKK